MIEPWLLHSSWGTNIAIYTVYEWMQTIHTLATVASSIQSKQSKLFQVDSCQNLELWMKKYQEALTS